MSESDGKNRPSKSGIAHHEAGHAVARIVLGFYDQNLTVTIRPRGDAAGHISHEDDLFDGCTIERVENAVITIYAGRAAQIRHKPEEADLARRGAVDDDEKADYYLDLISQHDSLSPVELGERDDSLRHRTDALVAEHWHCITALAEELLQEDTISGIAANLIVDVANGTAERSELDTYRQFPGLRH